MERELVTFFQECGIDGQVHIPCTVRVLCLVCKDRSNYNRLVGILNEISLEAQDKLENDNNGKSGTEPG